MEELLIGTLEEMGYPIRRQGSFSSDEEYPEHFFTFWNNAADGESFYDNRENRIIWNYDLNFYSTDPNLIYKELLKAKSLLEKVGFLLFGKGYDVASDEPTHTGRGINVLFLEN